MTEELRLLLLDHATGYSYWTPPVQWYVTYFLDGSEVSGITRQPISFAEAEAISSTVTRSGSSDSQVFENVPTTDTDEMRIVDTASGAIGLTGWVIEHIRSFTSGDDKGYAVDKIGVNLSGFAG